MKTRILLVEDDGEQSRPLTQMLGYRGYEVTSACNGKDGVALAVANPPDLVIVDLLLFLRGDEMDGFDVIQALRRHPTTAQLAILAWTGHFVQSTDWIRALRSGADDYVTKDVEFGILEAKIEAILRRTRNYRLRK